VTADQLELLEKARESIAAAKLLLANRYSGMAASRAYFAMFYVAQALLAGEGLTFSKHSVVIAAFGQHFAKTGRAPVRFHRFLVEGQEVRLGSDYGPLQKVGVGPAEEQLSHAEEFLKFAEQRIGALPPTGEGER